MHTVLLVPEYNTKRIANNQCISLYFSAFSLGWKFLHLLSLHLTFLNWPQTAFLLCCVAWSLINTFFLFNLLKVIVLFFPLGSKFCLTLHSTTSSVTSWASFLVQHSLSYSVRHIFDIINVKTSFISLFYLWPRQITVFQKWLPTDLNSLIVSCLRVFYETVFPEVFITFFLLCWFIVCAVCCMTSFIITVFTLHNVIIFSLGL